MRKELPLIFAGCIIAAISCAQTVPINIGSTTLESSALYTTTDLPWELKYGPGDSLWMTTKQGRVLRIHPTNGGATLLLDHSASVWQNNESGMLGMTFHPAFATNPYVFIAYTYTSGGLNRERLSRFTYSGNTLANELVLIDGGNIAANTIHNGSRLLVLPDNTLLMTTGDANNMANPQNSSSWNGKILRINLDGTIPANNPDPLSRVYTKGHRNPQGLALHPNGKIYETEHGPNNNDEFQIIEAGRNYGWPNVEGFCDNDKGPETAFCTANNVKEPLASWLVAPNGTWAPNDLIWYANPAIPEFQNSFLITFLKTNKVRRVKLNATGDAITGETDFFVNQWGRLRDITAAPNGDLYIATNTAPFRIIRLHNSAAGPVPVYINSYKTVCTGDQLSIKWTTQNEVNNKRFLLYRSTDSYHFTLAATILTSAAGGNSNIPVNYTYTDAQGAAGKIFYRLVGEDLNGSRQELGIISGNCGGGIRFTLSPNPASGAAELNISGSAKQLRVKVYNTMGQLLYEAGGNSQVALPAGQWHKGLYIVTAAAEEGNILFRDKLIIQ